MYRRIKFALLGLACLLLLPTTVAPALAAGPSSPPLPSSPGVTSGTLTIAQLEAYVASLPAPTAAQIAAAQAIAAKHAFQGTVSIQYAPSATGGGKIGVTPEVSIGVNWWGIYLHLTQQDVHNIWDIIWASGIAATAAILCLPTGWLAVGCAIVGGVFAYLVAEVIWNYIGYYVPSCGVHIGYYWSGRWYWGNC
jgi:hypothetical protein